MADLNLNKTTGSLVQPLFQPVLNRHILTAAKKNLVHQQFGQIAQIPKGKGKVVSWDKLSPLPKAKVPLVEGVTPDGRAIHISRITAVPTQHGDYISTTDEFDFFAHDPDPRVLRLNEVLANQAGETLDSLTADVLATAKNVQFPNGKQERSTLTDADVITVAEIKKAVRTLKGNNAPKIDGKYVCIIHTDIAHDLTNDPDWKFPHQYVDTKQIYEGEIGELWGVKFVETTEAKIFRGEALAGYDELTIYTANNKEIVIGEALTEAQAEALASREILIYGVEYTIVSATSGLSGECKLTLDKNVVFAEGGMKIYPAGGSESGKPVYSTTILGADAYGTTNVKGNLENITKALGSAGSADPLNQRATIGWKAHHMAKILEELYMVRIESVSTRY
jgi:N4-gp56 family major capsid protein